ncbi:hypothetical protein AB4234_16160 [Vibrio cyclitrophicus]
MARIQHQKFVDRLCNELKLGLKELETNEEFRKRFDGFVDPMVYRKADLPP